MEQEQKMAVDDEKKLITLKNYLKKIGDTQIYNEQIISKRDEVVSVLGHLLTPLGMHIVTLKTLEAEITSVLKDELTDDLYESDPVFKDVQYYIQNSKDTFALQEKFIQIMSHFIISLISLSNDTTSISHAKESSTDDGTPTLSEEEREKLKRIAYTLILNYKQQTTPGKKKVLASRLLHFADTKEKYKIINDLFLDLIGERVLDKLKKIKLKEGDKHSADGNQEGRE